MKRNKNGKKPERNRNESESYPGMTGNKTTGNDCRISLRFCHFEEWIPRKFPDFPRIFFDFPCIFRKKYTLGALSIEGLLCLFLEIYLKW